MSTVTGNQPDGTPTWIDLGIPDLDRAIAFYGAVFGWDFLVGPEEAGRYTMCLLRGLPVAALMPNPDPTASAFWPAKWSLQRPLGRPEARRFQGSRYGVR